MKHTNRSMTISVLSCSLQNKFTEFLKFDPKDGCLSSLLAIITTTKKQFRNTGSSGISRHLFHYLPWRKATWYGKGITSFPPPHLAQEGVKLFCCCPAMCAQAFGKGQAAAPQSQLTSCSQRLTSKKFSCTWVQARTQHKPQSTGKKDKSKGLFRSANWISFVIYLNNKASPVNYLMQSLG